MSSPAPEASPSRCPGAGGADGREGACFLEVDPNFTGRPHSGQENWAGTVGGAGSLPCQLTDVVTSLSLARCLVTERVRPRSANQSVAP